MTKTVVVFDYGTGNIHSAMKAVEAAGANAVLTRNKKDCAEADGLLVPGVGAFAAVMDALRTLNATRIQSNQARYAYLLALAQLEQATGVSGVAPRL